MILVFIAVILAAMLLVSSYICYRLAFSVSEKDRKKASSIPDTEQYRPFREEIISDIRKTLDIPFEEVTVRSEDGLLLAGKYYHTADGMPLYILFHGYRSMAEKDFCIGLRLALERGFNVLSVDQRAHGKSEGRCLTFGVMERKDCLSWINYALGRFGEKTEIFLYGMSMGAATVLMAAGLPLPSNVKGIVADCGYSSPKAIIRKVMKSHGYPIFPVYELTRLGGMLYGGFDTESASATDAMKQCRIPVLLIHGEDDRFVPCDMSRENYAACACSDKRLLTVPGAGHGLSYLIDPKAYEKALREFEIRNKETVD